MKGLLLGLAELRANGVDVGEYASKDEIQGLCARVLETGVETTRRIGMVIGPPLAYEYHGTMYLGAAHGLAGILFALSLFPIELQRARSDAVSLVRNSVKYLAERATPAKTGNLACALEERPPHRPLRPQEKNELVHWCHGATGVIFLYARAYLLWREEIFLGACLRAGEAVWQRGLLRKGPG